MTGRVGLAGLLQFGHLTVDDGAELSQQDTVRIPLVEDYSLYRAG